jgi:alpha-amylase
MPTASWMIHCRRRFGRLTTAALTLGLGLQAHAAAPVDVSPVPFSPRAEAGRALPAGWHHGAFMEIFVRAYQDSDGDGIGDLKGLISRLDYLQDLGIKGLWLMPVTRSADGDHGYATTDFRAIEPAYGTLADFDELLQQARRRGIGVVIDYVINHSAAAHPLFIESLKGPDNPYRDWYVWSDAAPSGWNIWDKNPWYHAETRPWLFKGEPKDLPPPAPGARGHYFGTFGPQMPDFNFRRPEVVAYHFDSLRFWLNRGLAGYRLDAVPHLLETDAVRWNDQPESRRLTKQMQDLIKAYPNRYVVCEATAEPQAYGDPAVCGGAFAFGYVQHFVRAAQGQAGSVQKLAEFYRTASPTMATFVSSHDIFAGRRLWDQVQGDASTYRLAAAGYLLQPGTPFIYYGEEVGMAGLTGLPGDQPLRGPMSWTAGPGAGFSAGTPFRATAPNAATQNAEAARADPTSIHAFYKALLTLRNTRASIARGNFEASFADGLVMGYQRVLEGERTLVVFNYGSTPAGTTVTGLPARAPLAAAYPAGGQWQRADAEGAARIVLPPRSVQVFAVGR